MRTVDHGADDLVGERDSFAQLPERVQETLGELAGAAKEGLLALSVGVGLGVLAELMAEEVDDVGRAQGPARPGPIGGPPRPRGRRGYARRSPGAGRAPAGQGERRLG